MSIQNPYLINSFNYTAFFVLVLDLVYCFIAGGLNRKHKRLFIALILCVMITTVAAVGSWDLQTRTSVANGKDIFYGLREACDTIYYIVHCLTAFLFTFYILEYTSFLSWKKWYNYVLLSAPAMIVSVLMLLNPIFHHFWSYVPIDGVYVYTRGDALWVVYALPIIYSIAGVVFFCLSTRTMPIYYRVAVLFLFSFTFVGIAIQFFAPAFQVEMITEAITITGILALMEDHVKFIDPVTRLSNYGVLERDIKKLIQTKHKFLLVVVHLDNYSHYARVLKKNLSSQLLIYVASHISKLPHVFDCYKVSSSCYALILDTIDDIKIEEFKTALKEFFLNPYNLNDVSLKFFINATFLRVPYELPDSEYLPYLIEVPENPNNKGIVFKGAEYFTTIKRRDQVEKAIRQGIQQKNFVLYYQPIYSVAENRIIACEGLARLIDPELGLISPGEFIPIAEKAGLMNEIGDQIYDMACKFIASGQMEKYGLGYLEVNLSVFQLYNQNLASEILATMNKYHVAPEYINLEITESAAVDSALASADNLRKLYDAGITFSLDDFGVGYSNYSILDRMTFKNVKLDISLLNNAKLSAKANVLHSGLIYSLSHIGQSLIQEGVETKEDLMILKKADPNILIQGYYFSKPLPEEEFITYLDNFKGVEF